MTYDFVSEIQTILRPKNEPALVFRTQARGQLSFSAVETAHGRTRMRIAVVDARAVRYSFAGTDSSRLGLHDIEGVGTAYVDARGLQSLSSLPVVARPALLNIERVIARSFVPLPGRETRIGDRWTHIEADTTTEGTNRTIVLAQLRLRYASDSSYFGRHLRLVEIRGERRVRELSADGIVLRELTSKTVGSALWDSDQNRMLYRGEETESVGRIVDGSRSIPIIVREAVATRLVQ